MKIKHLCLIVLGIALISILASPVLGWDIEGLSPGYWKGQTRRYVDKGPNAPSVHHDMAALTADINEWWTMHGDDLPTVEGYDAYLVPVSQLDVIDDDTFTIEDAYAIFAPNSPWKNLWKPLANWYNYVMGWLPYTD